MRLRRNFCDMRCPNLFLWDKNILEWKITSVGRWLVCKQKVAIKGKDLNQKLMFSKYVLNCDGAVKKLMQSNVLQTGVWGWGPQSPEAMGKFLKIRPKFQNFI